MLLIIFVLLAVCLLYVQSYYKISAETRIIQTPLSAFHPDLLLEKQPIYVEDPMYNPMDVIASVFKYQYVQKILSLSDTSLQKRLLSRFVVIYNEDDDEDVPVAICNPNDCRSSQFYSGFMVNKCFNIGKTSQDDWSSTVVVVKPKNMLILPVGWVYQTWRDGVMEIHLFDCISKINSFL